MGRTGPLTLTEEQRRAFAAVQFALRDAVSLAGLDPSLPTYLETDYSTVGIAFVLKQRLPTGQYRVIACASRTTTAAEARYKRVPKGELLAFRWALSRVGADLRSRHFFWVCDSKPLEQLRDGGGDADGELVRTFVHELAEYNYTFIWRSGADSSAVDGPSRNPVEHAGDHDEAPPAQVGAGYATCFVARAASWQREQATDATLQLLHTRAVLRRTDPAAAAVADQGPRDAAHRAYFDDDGFLRVTLPDGSTPMAVPFGHRTLTLYDAHAGHVAARRMEARMRGEFWWPGQSQDCDDFTAVHCTTCVQARQVRIRGNLGATDTTYGKFESVQVDLFGPLTVYDAAERPHPVYVFTAVDECTAYLESAVCSSKEMTEVTAVFERCWLHRYGKPVRVLGDGAFDTEAWRALARRHGFVADVTPPHDFRPRGVERSHRTLGAALAKDAQDMLLQHAFTLDRLTAILADATYAMNTAANRLRGTSSYCAVFGQADRRATHAQLGISTAAVIGGGAAAVAEETRLRSQAYVRRAVALRTATAQKNVAAATNVFRPAVGSLVMLELPRTGDVKLLHRMTRSSGPYQVLELSNDGGRALLRAYHYPNAVAKWHSVRHCRPTTWTERDDDAVRALVPADMRDDEIGVLAAPLEIDRRRQIYVPPGATRDAPAAAAGAVGAAGQPPVGGRAAAPSTAAAAAAAAARANPTAADMAAPAAAATAGAAAAVPLAPAAAAAASGRARQHSIVGQRLPQPGALSSDTAAASRVAVPTARTPAAQRPAAAPQRPLTGNEAATIAASGGRLRLATTGSVFDRNASTQGAAAAAATAAAAAAEAAATAAPVAPNARANVGAAAPALAVHRPADNDDDDEAIFHAQEPSDGDWGAFDDGFGEVAAETEAAGAREAAGGGAAAVGAAAARAQVGAAPPAPLRRVPVADRWAHGTPRGLPRVSASVIANASLAPMVQTARDIVALYDGGERRMAVLRRVFRSARGAFTGTDAATTKYFGQLACYPDDAGGFVSELRLWLPVTELGGIRALAAAHAARRVASVPASTTQ